MTSSSEIIARLKMQWESQQPRFQEMEDDPNTVRANDLHNFHQHMPGGYKRKTCDMPGAIDGQRTAMRSLLTNSKQEAQQTEKPAVHSPAFYALIDELLDEMQLTEIVAEQLDVWRNPRSHEVPAGQTDDDRLHTLYETLLPVYRRMRAMGYTHRDLTE